MELAYDTLAEVISLQMRKVYLFFMKMFILGNITVPPKWNISSNQWTQPVSNYPIEKEDKNFFLDCGHQKEVVKGQSGIKVK